MASKMKFPIQLSWGAQCFPAHSVIDELIAAIPIFKRDQRVDVVPSDEAELEVVRRAE